MHLKKILPFLIALFSLPFITNAQVTTSSMNGQIKNNSGATLPGASIIALHIPTGTYYKAASNKVGNFYFANMNPGGPYVITISYSGFQTITREVSSLDLGETSVQNFVLQNTLTDLGTVVVTTTPRITSGGKGGTETSVGRDKMQNLPSVGRNIADYLRYVPQAKITGDGGISLAGQNNRYNSFYIDGAVNNDVFGLAASGTNGGQTGIAPISIDAIDQFQVVLSPYDPSLGNFTGGGINAITKSGTNELHGSVYHLFRNEGLTGRTPGVTKEVGQKLADFSNKTTGFRLGGAILKNKLFFFVNGEIQRDLRPQPVDLAGYRGNSSIAQIEGLRSFLKTTYGYEAGGFVDNPEVVEANRVATKIDWNINEKNKLSVSYRYNYGFRNNTSRSSNNTINFYNNGISFPSTTNSGSLELNSRLKGNSNNKLLITYTSVEDDRGAIGDPFPRVSIRDGAANIIFGTEEFSTGNYLKQDNIALFDVFKFYKGKNTFSIGTDNEFSKSTNIFIRQNYGSYQYDSLSGFLNGLKARQYDRSYSLLDPGKSGDESLNAAAKFNSVRAGIFAGDEIKVNDRLTVSLGVRADYTKFITTPREDKFFNDSAISKISPFYDLKGARSGQINSPKVSLNPRIGFVYKIPDESLTIRGGVGTFTGRVPLVWPGGVYNNNGISVGGIRATGAQAVTFRSNPFNQYVASDIGITLPSPSGQVDLLAKDFRLNKVFRTSLAVDKQLANKLKLTFEAMFTKNINEIDYKRVDIRTPTLKSVGPDERDVYTTGTSPAVIPIRANGTNPYTGIYLLSNNEGKKGYSYNFTVTIDKAWDNNWSFNANYNFGNSVVKNEGTSSQNNSQWRFMETVNGRNNFGLSRSDYDLGHRISAYTAKKFNYANKKLATTISFVYNGQSGNPFSYVTAGSMVRDNASGDGNDLLFIPTTAQLNGMVFLSNTVGTGATAVTFTPQQQRDAFEQFIVSDKYLSKNRGQYAERNGARTPFTHVVDLKLQQDFTVKFGAKSYALQLTFDMFNFTNFLSSKAGKQFFLGNDQSGILTFASYVSATNLTPQYRFTPRTASIFNISDGVFNSSRWSSQIGIRLSF
jgi:outer membrane receptor protein involved in Fe transport